jgi:hypothetical protein
MKAARALASGAGAAFATTPHVAFWRVSYVDSIFWHAADAHEGGGAGVGVLPLMHANSTLLLFWQPAATSAADLNQHVPPERTPAAQSVCAWHSEQQISFVAAGAESRLPWPRSQLGVNVHALEASATSVAKIAEALMSTR